MKKKRVRFKPKIRPLRRKCSCGKRVLNHHFLCDKCWGEKAKLKHWGKKKKLLKPIFEKYN